MSPSTSRTPYIGDLVIELTSPLGQTVTLHDRSGGSADDLQVTYDDEGHRPVRARRALRLRGPVSGRYVDTDGYR